MSEKVRTLVLSGGSVKGIAILGSIQCLVDRGLLKDVTIFIGTSVGSIIAFLMILGFSPVEIMVILCQKGFLEKIIQIDMSRLFHGERSVASFQGIQEFLEKCSVQKYQRYFTLSQLYEITGKRLVCCTYNYTQRRTEYLSPESHPDLPCITAIRMSAALPFLFEPFPYMNSVYMDGGIHDDFPIGQIDTDAGGAFAIRVVNTLLSADTPQSDSLMDYITVIIESMKQNVQNLRISMYEARCHQIFTLSIDPDIGFLRFGLSTTQKFDLFSQGYQSTEKDLLSP